MDPQELLYPDPHANRFSLSRFVRSIFASKKSPYLDDEGAQVLRFDGMNPLLAKQLTEVETQIGQLVQAQYEINLERKRMRFEMDALKRSLQGNLKLAPQP